MEMTQEFFDCLTWSGAAFVCGICLREWGYDALGKWIGRANVAAALFVMSAFGLHSVRECSTLIQLVEHKNAGEIAAVPIVTGYEIKTKSGSIISWGGPGTVPTATGRIRGSFVPSGLGNRTASPKGHGADDLSHAKHATTSRTAATWADATNANIGGGKDF
jgi:hypothetical protein